MIDINEVSKKSGFAPSKLRYYEEVGLIKSIGRKGLKRIFNESVLLNLSLISLGQEVGFSLKELKSMLGSNGQFKINRNKLIEKAHEIDLKMKKLKAVRDGLLHASACPEKSHLDCPKFQSYLKL